MLNAQMKNPSHEEVGEVFELGFRQGVDAIVTIRRLLRDRLW
jgi:hypothetical protein